MNGWKNRETWLVACWMMNDQGMMISWQERAAELVEEYEDVKEAEYHLHEEIEATFEDEAFEITENNPMMNDLLMSAIANVEWYEITEMIMEDIEK